jgi:hypothetical protein
MRRSILVPSLLCFTLLAVSCGGETTAPAGSSNTPANVTGAGGHSTTTTTGESAGTGPKSTGIGGTSDNPTSNTGVVNGNTYTVPPGFNKNGDKGATTSNTKP